ncbi:hypothetical protein Tco_0343748 [Tanacetum coccineum]
MEILKADQIALDDALVAPANRLKIGTDKSEITRKQSKASKHGHENQKSAKPKPQKTKALANFHLQGPFLQFSKVLYNLKRGNKREGPKVQSSQRINSFNCQERSGNHFYYSSSLPFSLPCERLSDDDKNDDDENAQDDDDEAQNESEDDVRTPFYVSSSDDEDSDNEVDEMDVEGEKSDKDATYVEDQGNEADRDTNANLKKKMKKKTDVVLPSLEDHTKNEIVNEQLEYEVLVRSLKEAKTSHVVAANLSELELKKILIDKMEVNKSINMSDVQRQLYKALVDAYEADKILLDTYGIRSQ